MKEILLRLTLLLIGVGILFHLNWLNLLKLLLLVLLSLTMISSINLLLLESLILTFI